MNSFVKNTTSLIGPSSVIYFVSQVPHFVGLDSLMWFVYSLVFLGTYWKLFSMIDSINLKYVGLNMYFLGGFAGAILCQLYLGIAPIIVNQFTPLSTHPSYFMFTLVSVTLPAYVRTMFMGD